MLVKSFRVVLAVTLGAAATVSAAASSVIVSDSILISVAPLGDTSLAIGAYAPNPLTDRYLTISTPDFGGSAIVAPGASGDLEYGIADLAATPSDQSVALNVPSVSPPAGYVEVSVATGVNSFTLAPQTELVISDTYAMSLWLNNSHGSTFALDANLALYGSMYDANWNPIDLSGDAYPSDSVNAEFGVNMQHDGALYLTFDNTSNEIYTGSWQEGITAETYGLSDSPATVVPEPDIAAFLLAGFGVILVSGVQRRHHRGRGRDSSAPDLTVPAP